MYTVVESPEFIDSLKKQSWPVQKKLSQFLELLKNNPDQLIWHSKSLSNGTYMYRINIFLRLNFSINWETLTFENIIDTSKPSRLMELIRLYTKLLKFVWIACLVLIVIISVLIIVDQYNKYINTWKIISNNIITDYTWSNIYTTVVFSWWLSLREYDQDQINSMSMFPEVEIGSWNIEKAVLRIIVDFNKDYQQYWKGRIYWYAADWTPAKWFVYALRIAIWDINNGWYFDTTRIYTDEVKSDPDNWLFGATQWVGIMWWKLYEIDLWNFIIANKPWLVWFTWQNYIPYLNSMKWKTIPIGSYLSDFKWTYIKYIEIEYIGDKDTITSVK